VRSAVAPPRASRFPSSVEEGISLNSPPRLRRGSRGGECGEGRKAKSALRSKSRRPCKTGLRYVAFFLPPLPLGRGGHALVIQGEGGCVFS